MTTSTIGKTIGAAIGKSAAYTAHGAIRVAQGTGRFGQDVLAGAAEGYTEKLRALEVQHDEMTVAMWDEAYVRACEIESPSSPDFDALQESIYEELFA